MEKCFSAKIGINKHESASVAQWQSNGFVNRRLWVQVPPLAQSNLWKNLYLKKR